MKRAINLEGISASDLEVLIRLNVVILKSGWPVTIKAQLTAREDLRMARQRAAVDGYFRKGIKTPEIAVALECTSQEVSRVLRNAIRILLRSGWIEVLRQDR